MQVRSFFAIFVLIAGSSVAQADSTILTGSEIKTEASNLLNKLGVSQEDTETSLQRTIQFEVVVTPVGDSWSVTDTSGTVTGTDNDTWMLLNSLCDLGGVPSYNFDRVNARRDATLTETIANSTAAPVYTVSY